MTGWRASFHRGRPSCDSHGPMTAVRIVLHSTESDGDGAAYGDDICGFWHRQGKGYGAHFVVSRDGAVTTCLGRGLIAWHVQSHNTGSVGIEQAGYAHFTHAQWSQRERELDSTARLLARLAHFHEIPLDVSTERGVSTHAMQSHEYGGDHHDPGDGYPLSHVMGMARSYLHAGGWNGTWRPCESAGK